VARRAQVAVVIGRGRRRCFSCCHEGWMPGCLRWWNFTPLNLIGIFI
jgi:hypothetical protein